jgi:hypothetical protein
MTSFKSLRKEPKRFFKIVWLREAIKSRGVLWKELKDCKMYSIFWGIVELFLRLEWMDNGQANGKKRGICRIKASSESQKYTEDR